MSFIEAVEILAREAGMTMPAQDPEAQQKSDRRGRLAEVMETALRHFRLQLQSGAGSAARDYLAGRGLDAAALDRWEIGFAADAWQGLWDHLKGKGVDDDLILDAGLAKPSRKGGKPYDTFRGRVMFPIRDARGRCIAFGGRAMDPGDQAKYLNSPDTELFDKGRTLYNIGPAREAAGKGKPLIVAEGYMDVIALSEAGFPAAVAPLGTAVTEHQLAMLWRVADEPIVALDGDEAGLRAALRVVDLALPLLEAGKSLRFAMMPEGQDPDDLLRAGGAGAVRKVLDRAMPMVELLWQRETADRNFDGAEGGSRQGIARPDQADPGPVDPSALWRRDQGDALAALSPDAETGQSGAGRMAQAALRTPVDPRVTAGRGNRPGGGTAPRGGDPGCDPAVSRDRTGVRRRP